MNLFDDNSTIETRPLPQGWRWTRLGEESTTTSGGTPSRNISTYYGGNIPWVKSGELKDCSISVTEETITQDGLANSSAKIFPAGTLLIALYGATVGKLGVLEIEAATNQAVCAIHLSESIQRNYLFFYLLHQRPLLIERSAGGAQPNISQDIIRNLEVPLPPLSQQKRIAAILEKADSLRRLRRYAQQMSDTYLQSAFVRMFGDPATNPKCWPTRVIEEILSDEKAGIRTGPFGSSLKRHEYVEKGIPVWGINNVRVNEFVEDFPLYITETKYRELVNYTVHPGDILISRAGTVGRMCVARPSNQISIIGTNLVRVALDFSVILPEYFTALFSYFPDRVGNLRMTNDENAYSFLNPGVLQTIRIPVPPLTLQQSFVQTAQRLQTLRTQQREAERQAEHLFQTLLYQAFRGEL